MTKSTLQQQLETLSAARYPLHMPGHKRRVPPAPGLGCYAWDLTEIDGADDLHDADGILADAMARTAACWRASAHWHRSAARSLRRATATRPSTTRLSWGS